MTQSQTDSLRFTQPGTEHSKSSAQTLKGLRALLNKERLWINKQIQKTVLPQILILLLDTENIFA